MNVWNGKGIFQFYSKFKELIYTEIHEEKQKSKFSLKL